MNILYIAHEGGKNYNGASRSLVTLVKNFSINNNVHVVIPESGGALERALREADAHVLVLPIVRWVTHRRRNPIKWLGEQARFVFVEDKINRATIEKLVQYCQENQIEIIHTNSSVVNVGAIAAQIVGVPHVWHFREFGQEDFHMYPLVGRNAFEKSVKESHSKIICVSDAVKNKYQKRISGLDICTVYNGIPIPEKVEKTFDENCFNVLVTGLICEAKGQKVAIDAVKKLLRYGRKNLHLYLAGRWESEEYLTVCQEYPDNFHFLGQVEDILQVRRTMDLELVCSKSEAFGRVTVEAMAAQLPVIGSNTGGTPELIQDGENGFLFPFGDSDKLAERIDYFYNNRSACLEIGKDAYESVAVKFSEKRLIEEIDHIYKAMLSN